MRVSRRFLKGLVQCLVISLTSHLLPLTTDVVNIAQRQSRKSQHVRCPAPVAVEQHAHRECRHQFLLHLLVGLLLAQHRGHPAVVLRLCRHAVVVAYQPYHLLQSHRLARHARQALEQTQFLLNHRYNI